MPFTSESKCYGVEMSEAFGLSKDPQDHDFDWVAAREACCNPLEFLKMRAMVQKNCEHRNKSIGFKPDFEIIFHPDREGTSFSVERTNPRGHPYFVRFRLDNDGIHIEGPGGLMVVTAQLTEQQTCRLAIDGEGEYLRWQVVRKVLHKLFYWPLVKEDGGELHG